MLDKEKSAKNWILAFNAPYMLQTLKAIANLTVNDSTNHAQLSALCMAMAKTAMEKIESAVDKGEPSVPPA